MESSSEESGIFSNEKCRAFRLICARWLGTVAVAGGGKCWEHACRARTLQAGNGTPTYLSLKILADGGAWQAAYSWA